MTRLLLLLAMALLLSPTAAMAQASQAISYQGQLLDTDGVLLEGQVAVQVRVYEAEVPFVGETALYIENHTNVPVTVGVFNVAVGTGPPGPRGDLS